MLHGIIDRIVGLVKMMERERQAQALCAARGGLWKWKHYWTGSSDPLLALLLQHAPTQ